MGWTPPPATAPICHSGSVINHLIRPFVIGRRSWLFADTAGGANAGANLYSLIETAKANNVEPYR